MHWTITMTSPNLTLNGRVLGFRVWVWGLGFRGLGFRGLGFRRFRGLGFGLSLGSEISVE